MSDISTIINKKVDEYFDQILEALKKVIAINSVMGEPKDGMPFGEGPAKALDETLKIAEELGFKGVNVDNYAGHVEYGEGGKLYAILGHLDVVPEGDRERWTNDPFELVIRDGKMYGRGVSDDKGPSIGALFALKIASELVDKPKNRVRVIFGTNEENGSQCLKYYFTKEPYPDAAVTPDGDFPAVFAEKGIVTYSIRRKISKHYSTKLLELRAGTAANVVPEECVAVIGTDKVNEIAYLVSNYVSSCKYEYEVIGDSIIVKSLGKSAHGAHPEAGINAAAGMLELLSRIDFGPENETIRVLYERLGKDYYGIGLGISGQDDVSKKLTCNLGILKLEDDTITAVINIRHPIFFNVDMITMQIKEAMKGFEVERMSYSKPLYVSKDSDFMRLLLRIYREETGDMSEPISIGGGTYARSVPYGVAYGAVFPGEDTHMHQPDECWSLESFKKFIRIYTKLIYCWLSE
ncbi:succinyl-diaminopimelate desuccinylase [Fervidobacterium changbaicum]|uniref:Dipeptidase PepV n=1 Tax=Fervidobacterium changbaicum TaxID=310769 RepID=A0ABX5QR39_9BACT|nr:dipeptidase PepV [Fervidobacterium changbaicum]QAV32919.1 dipeptidase PepV [Fervidobacterium changbaicum]SDH48353.1 succinyl-diaminopimelate desuccinylase [Fervidobacterium changbaicum]